MTERGPIIVVGAASRDITADDPRGWRLGGAVTYASLLLARFGFDVRSLVGVDDAASTSHELDSLASAGAVVVCIPLASGPVFENIDGPDGRRQVCRSTSDVIPTSALPAAWVRNAASLFLGPVADELDAAWARPAAQVPLVALGWQGLLRELRAGTDVVPRAPAPGALLRVASMVGVSREDLPREADGTSLATWLAPGSTLLVTEGAEGGDTHLHQAHGSVASSPYLAIPSDCAVDPTGAGDVFLAAFLAATLRPSLGEPTTMAAAAASLVIEAPGLDGVPDLAAVLRRATRAPSLASRRPSAASSRTSGRPSQA